MSSDELFLFDLDPMLSGKRPGSGDNSTILELLKSVQYATIPNKSAWQSTVASLRLGHQIKRRMKPYVCWVQRNPNTKEVH